uniref:Uncharacterized protein n=1 Tax=Rhizophora mucronata TaxID=61149 RepID=A0A2P2NT31_RHIMU
MLLCHHCQYPSN